MSDVQTRINAHPLKKNWISHTPGVLLVRICLRHKSNLQQAKPRDFPADLSYSVPLRGSATLAKALTTIGPATTPKEVASFFFDLGSNSDERFELLVALD